MVSLTLLAYYPNLFYIDYNYRDIEIQEGTETPFDNDVFDPVRNKMDAPLVLPFPLTARISYFLFQAPDLRSLVVSKRKGN